MPFRGNAKVVWRLLAPEWLRREPALLSVTFSILPPQTHLLFYRGVGEEEEIDFFLLSLVRPVCVLASASLSLRSIFRCWVLQKRLMEREREREGWRMTSCAVYLFLSWLFIPLPGGRKLRQLLEAGERSCLRIEDERQRERERKSFQLGELLFYLKERGLVFSPLKLSMTDRLPFKFRRVEKKRLKKKKNTRSFPQL